MCSSSPDYDAPSPQADEMELELPEDAATPAVIEVHDTTSVRNNAGGSSNGDLNSRLSSMMESIPGVVRNLFFNGFLLETLTRCNSL